VGLAGCSLARHWRAQTGPAARFLHSARRASELESWRPLVGRILIGVVIGVILMIWLLVSCASAIF
jgi:hypothetical protein